MEFKEYSDDQARDEHGMWTSGGSVGLTEYNHSKTSKAHQTTYHSPKGKVVNVQETPRRAQVELHSTEDGRRSYTTVHEGSPKSAKEYVNKRFGIKHTSHFGESDPSMNYFYTVDTKELVFSEAAYCASDSHAGLERKLSSAIDGKVQAGADMGQGDQSKERANSNYPVHYVQAVHDKHVIYSNGGKTFAHKYEKDGDGDPQLKGNPQEVEHSFTPITKAKESFAESMQFEPAGTATNSQLLCESFGDKGEINFTVIKPGWSKNNRYYSADLLKSRANIFEGAKMFADHATDKESASRPEGSVNNWVANITKVWAEGDGTVKATAKVIDPAFKAKLALLGESKMLNTMGVSIRAMGEAKPGEAEGRKGNVVESLLAARSVDFVTFAGAGGEVESLN